MIAVQQSNETPAVFASTVVQLGSPARAEKVLSWVYNDSTSPCPNVCTVDIETFDVPGIPGANGIKRSRAEDHGRRRPGGAVRVLRGGVHGRPVLYDLLTLGAKPGEVSQDTMLAAAQGAVRAGRKQPAAPGG